MGDTAAILESDLDSDLDSCRSSTLRGMERILPRVQVPDEASLASASANFLFWLDEYEGGRSSVTQSRVESACS